MTIRRRTARRITQLGLGAAGAVHLLWAAGSSWPSTDRDQLADLVVGARPFPSSPMTLGVVAAIGVGMYLVGRESRRRESARPNESLVQTAATIAAVGVPTVLALRGVGGLVASAFELGTATPIFRRWDLLLYSPLCIVLAVAAAVAIAPPGPPAPVSGRTDTQPKMAPT